MLVKWYYNGPRVQKEILKNQMSVRYESFTITLFVQVQPKLCLLMLVYFLPPHELITRVCESLFSDSHFKTFLRLLSRVKQLISYYIFWVIMIRIIILPDTLYQLTFVTRTREQEYFLLWYGTNFEGYMNLKIFVGNGLIFHEYLAKTKQCTPDFEDYCFLQIFLNCHRSDILLKQNFENQSV